MKKIISLLLVLLLALTSAFAVNAEGIKDIFGAKAESTAPRGAIPTGGLSNQTYGSLTWSLTEDGALTISGTGALNSPGSGKQWRPYSNEIVSVTIGSGITSIGGSVFYYWSLLESVELPDTLQSIGSSAFYGCEHLAGSTIEIPNGVTSIQASAFNGTGATIIVPSTVTSMADNAFSGSTNTKCNVIITLPNNFVNWTTTYGSSSIATNAASVSVIFPSGTTAINESALSSITNLKSVEIPSTVTSIGNYAFNNCEGLAHSTIELPNGVLTIGDQAFYNAGANIVVPSTVTSIGYMAFGGSSDSKKCTVELTVPNNFDTWTNTYNSSFREAMSGSAGLSVVIPSGATAISNSAFNGVTVLKSVEIPDTVTSIGDYAFYNTKIQHISIPEDVTSIGNYAFANSSLEAVALPEGLLTVGDNAFKSQYLKYVSLPSTLTTIGSTAFNDEFNNYNHNLTYVINNSSLNIVAGSDTYGGVAKNAVALIDSNSPHYGDFYFAESGSDNLNTTTWELVYYAGSNANVTLPDVPLTLSDNTIINDYDIGICAFYNRDDIESVHIPDHVGFINNYAFAYCKNLTEVRLPEGPSTGRYAFNYTGLTSIYLPDQSNYTTYTNFVGCEDLKVVFTNNSTLQNNAKGSTGYGYVGYYADLIIPPYHIGDFYFALDDNNNWQLAYYAGNPQDTAHFALPEVPFALEDNAGTVTQYSIRERTFEGMFDSLEHLIIPEGVTGVGYHGLAVGAGVSGNNVGLRVVEIPSTVTSLDSSATGSHSGLIKLVNKSSVSLSEMSGAYETMTHNAHIVVDSTVPYVQTSSGKFYFDYNNDLQAAFTYHSEGTNTSLYMVHYEGDSTSVTLPSVPFTLSNGQTITDNYKVYQTAFLFCDDIEELTIPTCAETIDPRTFYGCSIDEMNVLDTNEFDMSEQVIDNDYTYVAPDLSSYTSVKNADRNNDSNTMSWLTQSAKWTDASQTTAELRIDLTHKTLADVSYLKYTDFIVAVPRDFEVNGGWTDAVAYSEAVMACAKLVGGILEGEGNRVALVDNDQMHYGTANSSYMNDLTLLSGFSSDAGVVCNQILSGTFSGRTLTQSDEAFSAISTLLQNRNSTRKTMILYCSNRGNVGRDIYNLDYVSSVKNNYPNTPIACVVFNVQQSGVTTELERIATNNQMIFTTVDEDGFVGLIHKAMEALTAKDFSYETTLSSNFAITNTSGIKLYRDNNGTPVEMSTTGIVNTSVAGGHAAGRGNASENKISVDLSDLNDKEEYFITVPLALTDTTLTGNILTNEPTSSIQEIELTGTSNYTTAESPVLTRAATPEPTTYTVRYVNHQGNASATTYGEVANLADGATYPLPQTQNLTGFVDGVPVSGTDIFAGWFTTKAASQKGSLAYANAAATTITVGATADAADGATDGVITLYAGWVAPGSVTRDAADLNTSTTYQSGFSLEGVQIKSKDIPDEGVERANWQGATYNGMRFVTVYRNGLLTELDNLFKTGNPNYASASDTAITYGYMMYARDNITSLAAGSLKSGLDGAVDVDCTRDGNMNHKMFDAYRLSTIVVRYDSAEEQTKAVEARAYVNYVDANGFARRAYNTYTGSTFAGGCRAVYNDAYTALTRVSQ